MIMTLSRPCPTKATDEELLATFLPQSTVKELVAEYGTVRQVLMNSYPDELERLKGIGPVKARQLQYVCELAKRLYQATAEFPSFIRSQQIVTSVREVDNIGKNIASQTQTVSAATEEQSASMEEIASSSESLSQMAQELQRAVSKFRV